MKKPIVLKNFISEEDCKVFIEYMDNNQGWFEETGNGTVFHMYTGTDNHHQFETKFNDSKYDSIRELIIKYGNKVEESIKENFPVDYSIYLTQFWMTKRFPGTFGKLHGDTDGGKNSQIKFSGIIYLNTIAIGGELMFPHLNYTYSPKQGDIVLFESADPDFRHGVYPCKENRYVLPIWVTDKEEYALLK